jgi:hypothetical protein
VRKFTERVDHGRYILNVGSTIPYVQGPKAIKERKRKKVIRTITFSLSLSLSLSLSYPL